MSITRRKVLAGSAVGAASLASGLAAPAIAANEPIKIGYLPALTGPSSSTGVGINRGTVLAVDEINAAGGVDGRKLELIVRDTQSDPTKAVNAVAELTQRQKVALIWGPVNSGEALAATPLIARDKVPMIHPCWVDQLIDVKKYPMAFRNAPTNQQIGGAANHYVVDVLKLKKAAVISDTTGYGTSTTLNPALVTTHSQALSGLAIGTTYHYRAKSADGQSLEDLSYFAAALRVEAYRYASKSFFETCRQYFWNFMYCQSSFYDQQLTRYFSLFDRDRFHVLSLGELASDPAATTGKIAAFLELDQASLRQFDFQISNDGGRYFSLKARAS